MDKLEWKTKKKKNIAFDIFKWVAFAYFIVFANSWRYNYSFNFHLNYNIYTHTYHQPAANSRGNVAVCLCSIFSSCDFYFIAF